MGSRIRTVIKIGSRLACEQALHFAFEEYHENNTRAARERRRDCRALPLARPLACPESVQFETIF